MCFGTYQISLVSYGPRTCHSRVLVQLAVMNHFGWCCWVGLQAMPVLG
jgi:hypothetical protein